MIGYRVNTSFEPMQAGKTHFRILLALLLLFCIFPNNTYATKTGILRLSYPFMPLIAPYSNDTLKFSIYLVNNGNESYNYAGGSYRLDYNTAAITGGFFSNPSVIGSGLPLPLVITNWSFYDVGHINGGNSVPAESSQVKLNPGDSVLIVTVYCRYSQPINHSREYLTWSYLPSRVYVFIQGETGPTTTIPLTLSSTPYFVPVEIVNFRVGSQRNYAELKWQTAAERNSASFNIERKLGPAGNWLTVGCMKAAGSSDSTRDYRFLDENLQPGAYSYRLKMIDRDGSFKYSVVEGTEIDSPEKFSLSQNFPNPFNPSTTIAFNLPAEAKVSLKVYDVKGELIFSQMDKNFASGVHEFTFDAGQLPSGVYMYEVSAAETGTGKLYREVRKMILAK